MKKSKIKIIKEQTQIDFDEKHYEYDVLIDDSLWGNPLLSVLQGLYSFRQDKFITEMIDIFHVKSPNFENKTYLNAIAEASLKMVKELNISKNEHILVCRGYCNKNVKPLLEKNGYTNISIGVVGEPLQTLLENEAWKRIDEIGYSKYYDPKGMSKEKISKSFNEIIKWIVQNDKFDECKTGWDYFKQKKYQNIK